ncbi:hypothetical protein Fmac_012225 [Flemingia macrophylla]|uniref:Uncharacterized protein n=1 Tax=Flemingia macrophylla TaxID=520843 RepID=A0ABD1MPQ9_9FABA
MVDRKPFYAIPCGRKQVSSSFIHRRKMLKRMLKQDCTGYNGMLKLKKKNGVTNMTNGDGKGENKGKEDEIPTLYGEDTMPTMKSNEKAAIMVSMAEMRRG